VKAGRRIAVRYSAPRAGRLVVRLMRGRHVVRRRTFRVERGHGTVALRSKGLRRGRYGVRVLVGGSTIDLPLRIR
jgi:hypothetical protein